nr:hypothetical protein [Tanacetum cinerariifolium]
MDLLQNLLDICTTLTRRVENLEHDKIAQALEITKLKQRVKKLEMRNKLKVLKLRRLKKDVVADAKDVKDAEIEESTGDDDIELAELQEVVEVVTTAKLITEVVTAASATITVAAPKRTTAAAPTLTTAPSAARRRKGVVIRDPKETATPSTIIHIEPKSKENGKRIMDEVINQVKRKEKEDNVVIRYQALKRKPQTEAQARMNMMIYLRNVVGFKMDYFKGMYYDDICPIFEKKFNSNVAFLLKTKEQMEEEDSRTLKRKVESSIDKAAVTPIKIYLAAKYSKRTLVDGRLNQPHPFWWRGRGGEMMGQRWEVVARGGKWCGGSYRSGEGEYSWGSPKKFSGGGGGRRRPQAKRTLVGGRLNQPHPFWWRGRGGEMMGPRWGVATRGDEWCGGSYTSGEGEYSWGSPEKFSGGGGGGQRRPEGGGRRQDGRRGSSKKQKLDEEVEELRKHPQIVPNDDDDDVYTEATPLALKVPVVDYEIYTENNGPYYKIKRANGTHQLYISFLSMLRNFDREDLEVLWQSVKERFASSKPKKILR